MDELIKYFSTIVLPKRIIRINATTEVVNANLFIESCQRKHENGDPEGELLLQQFKIALVMGGYQPPKRRRQPRPKAGY